MTNEQTEGALRRGALAGDLQRFPRAGQRSYAAKNFAVRNQRIVLGQRVAAQNVNRLRLMIKDADDAMDEEVVGAADQNDVAHNWAITRKGLNGQTVAGKDGWKHTAATGDKTDFREMEQGLNREIKVNFAARFWLVVHHGEEGHEFFRLKRQEDWVAETLPQARAMVSKTRSCSNAGLT